MSKLILLIDDDSDEQYIFQQAVNASPQSIKCFFANNAKQGLAFLENFLPDFIFIDINMPGMSGLECLTEIHKKEALKNTPVIMYSTAVDEKITAFAKTLGAFNCIKKQPSVDTLTEMITEIINSDSELHPD